MIEAMNVQLLILTKQKIKYLKLVMLASNKKTKNLDMNVNVNNERQLRNRKNSPQSRLAGTSTSSSPSNKSENRRKKRNTRMSVLADDGLQVEILSSKSRSTSSSTEISPVSPSSSFDSDVSLDEELEKRHREFMRREKEKAAAEGRLYLPPLFHWDELPSFLRDNEFIHSGYRVYYSFRDNWLSIFMIHNETANIWTHMFGFFLFMGMLIFAHKQVPENAKFFDYVILASYFMCASACFLFSTLFHTHFCHSRRAFVKFGCLDYAGISTLICGSCIVVTYFGFYCEHFTRNTWIIITILMASVGIIGPFFEVWATRAFRFWRVIVYLLSGIASATPVFHFLAVKGFPETLDVTVYYLLIVMTCLYVGGAMIYAYRFPECVWPGRFDIWGSSHQVWHCCVVGACYVHYITATKLLEWRLQTGVCEV